MSRHTPGPWVLDESRHEGSINRMDPFRHIGMVSMFQYDHASRAENLANARLIAAAPDLLAALADCVEHMEWSNKYGRAARDKALIAIAKAKGEQS